MNQLRIKFQIKLQACESSFKSSFRSKLPYRATVHILMFSSCFSFLYLCFSPLLATPLASCWHFHLQQPIGSLKCLSSTAWKHKEMLVHWCGSWMPMLAQVSAVKKAIEASKKPLSIILWLSAQWITCAVSTLNTWLLLRNSEVDGSVEGGNPAYHERQRIKALVILYCNAIPHVYTTVSPMQLASSLLLLKCRICSVRMLTQ